MWFVIAITAGVTVVVVVGLYILLVSAPQHAACLSGLHQMFSAIARHFARQSGGPRTATTSLPTASRTPSRFLTDDDTATDPYTPRPGRPGQR